jgi:hypothetical protein
MVVVVMVNAKESKQEFDRQPDFFVILKDLGKMIGAQKTNQMKIRTLRPMGSKLSI